MNSKIKKDFKHSQYYKKCGNIDFVLLIFKNINDKYKEDKSKYNEKKLSLLKKSIDIKSNKSDNFETCQKILYHRIKINHNAKKYMKYAHNINTLFIDAFKMNSFKNIEYLIITGANIHFNNNEALLYITKSDPVEKFKILVENGFDKEFIKKYTIDSNFYGNLGIFKFLIQNGDVNHNQFDTIFLNAVKCGHFEIVKFLIKKRVNILAEAVDFSMKKNFQIFKYLIENGDFTHTQINRVFLNAVICGHFEIVKFLIEKGADIHTDNDKALRYSMKINFQIFKYLVENGANLHVKNNKVLIYFTKNKKFDVVKYLIQKGSDLHANEDYAFRYTAIYGDFGTFKYLINKGANIHAKDDQALFWANEYSRIKFVKLIIQSDIEYFKNNKIGIDVIKKRKLNNLINY